MPVATEELLGASSRPCTAARQPEFGWRARQHHRSTPQINTAEHDWLTFYREHRLPLSARACRPEQPGRETVTRGEQLLEKLPVFLRITNRCVTAAWRPVGRESRGVARWHTGDLRSGGVLRRSGNGSRHDRAVWGYSPGFYAAYNEAWPLDAGYRVRKNLYNLYHLFNHFNLFGGGYGGQSERIIDMLLSET